MTPDQLITFAMVAEHGNISRAAVALHLSQPAVSGQLRQLQDEFGETLYRREGRGIALTAAGEQLVKIAETLRTAFGQAHALRNALKGLESGMLRIGASTTPASYVLPYLIAEFHRRHPDVTIHTADGNSSEIVTMLGSLDIALIEGAEGLALPDDARVTPWLDDEIVAIAPRGHALASDGEDVVSLETLSGYPLVLRETGSGVRQLVERVFAQAEFPMRVAMDIAGVEGVKEAVRAGMGIGFVSAMSMQHEDGALVQLRVRPDAFTRRFSLLLPHAATASRAAESFYALCMERGAGALS